MPVAPVQYHWVMSPSSVVNPQTFHEYTTSITVPPNHTLRRVLLANTLFGWKRGSLNADNQEAYFVTCEVVYGAQLGAPTLFRYTRRIPSILSYFDGPLGENMISIHSAGDIELGVNEKVQRGGWGSPAQDIKLTWSIVSTGEGQETLAGLAGIPLRVLYSLPVPP